VIAVRDIEQAIREINGTMAIEGMPLTEGEKEELRSVMRGERSYADLIESILAEYRPLRA